MNDQLKYILKILPLITSWWAILFSPIITLIFASISFLSDQLMMGIVWTLIFFIFSTRTSYYLANLQYTLSLLVTTFISGVENANKLIENNDED